MTCRQTFYSENHGFDRQTTCVQEHVEALDTYPNTEREQLKFGRIAQYDGLGSYSTPLDHSDQQIPTNPVATTIGKHPVRQYLERQCTNTPSPRFDERSGESIDTVINAISQALGK